MRYLQELASFDRTIRLPATVQRPETVRHLEHLIRQSPRAIARGAGLSYSAASFGADVVAIDMTRFDRILDFDPTTGRVTVEPGIRIGALTEFLAKHGRFLPALPGYPSITIGGCVAFDIHGKSQAHSGNFSRWVRELTLQHADHGRLLCSREHESEAFDLTLGGMGLTGVITRVVLDTEPLESTRVELESHPVNDLREAAEVLKQRSVDGHSSYSWHDLNRRGATFGRGVVYVERFVPQGVAPSVEPARRDMTRAWPFGAWNGATTRVALGAYGSLARRAGRKQLPLQEALFPIYGKEYYYALFGRSGFREYQVIVRHESWPSFVEALAQLLARAGTPVTLGSLKVFSGTQRYLRFSGTGVCLALDTPATPNSAALFGQLDELTLAHQGFVNLSKDSRIDADVCQRIFPEYGAFVSAIRRFDPRVRHSSSLARQIGLRS